MMRLSLTAVVAVGLLLFFTVAFDAASEVAENDEDRAVIQETNVHKEKASREAAATPNAQVNLASGPATEQVNGSVALSDAVPGEVYGVWNEYLTVGPSPTQIGWSPSFGGGVPGSWLPSPLNPPPPPFQSEWNPDLASNPFGGYLMTSTGYIFPPYGAGAPDGIFMTPSPGGGAPFAGPVPIMMNTPPVNWLDYPVLDYDEGAASPNFGTAHIVWTEFLDGDGDPDGNGNFYDDLGDGYVIWSTFTSFGAGPFPFPGFAPPLPLGGGPTPISNAMQMQRAAIDVSHSGTAAMPFPGTAYMAHMDPGPGLINIWASERVSAAVPWAIIGSVPYAPLGPVVAPGIKVAGSVDLAVHNQPGSPCDGNLYLVWADGNTEIMYSRSFDGGVTWTPSLPIGPLIGDQWAPSITVDPLTGHICIMFYSQQTAPGVGVEVWRAMSVDCGASWRLTVLSDAGPTPFVTSIAPLPGPYVGDYLSSDVTATGGTLSGVFGGIWNDGRNGLDQDIFFDPDCNCCNHDGMRGDIDYNFSGSDVADLSYLVDYLFRSGPAPPCPEEADVDASGATDVVDLTYLVDYLFKGGPAPAPCP